LSVLILFSLSYSEPRVIGGTRPPRDFVCRHRFVNFSGDTLRLSHDEAYVLFNGAIQEPFYKIACNDIKIKSVIRGDYDTTEYKSIIRLFTPGIICFNKKSDLSKDYLVLIIIVYEKDHSYSSINCEEILNDTPENREILIKKYGKTIIIKEPKPSEAKKK
jgi:hypothetical protein